MKRTVSVLIAALLAGLFAGAARAEIKTQWIDYKQGDTPLRGATLPMTTASPASARVSC